MRTAIPVLAYAQSAKGTPYYRVWQFLNKELRAACKPSPSQRSSCARIDASPFKCGPESCSSPVQHKLLFSEMFGQKRDARTLTFFKRLRHQHRCSHTQAKQTGGSKAVEITVENEWFHFAGRAAWLFSLGLLVFSHKGN